MNPDLKKRIRESAAKSGVKEYNPVSPYAFANGLTGCVALLETERSNSNATLAVSVTPVSVEMWQHNYPLLHTSPQLIARINYNTEREMLAAISKLASEPTADCWKEVAA